MSRIFAISDLHVDCIENMYFVERLSFQKYQNDVLLLAGDVTDKMPLLKSALRILKKKFKEVCFVPGNHDIWIREPNSWEDSIGKFHRILDMCKSLNVKTDPLQVTLQDGSDVWIVPLFSWYSTPE
ncbi:metallophosphoesterase, partial [Salmonella sp. s55004]|uniref:metallophosphoesterase n=1 Tax=Salmonella sp. s55004 TaxID=3159675 RepID=UPI0039802C6F